jgi:hypothetical protein
MPGDDDTHGRSVLLLPERGGRHAAASDDDDELAREAAELAGSSGHAREKSG